MRHALLAEWTKLRTSSGTGWLLLATLISTAGIGLLASAAPKCKLPACGIDPVKLSLTGVQLGQTLVAILAVLVIGNEYTTGMIRVTLAALPRRHTVLAAKALVLTAPILLTSALSVLTSLLIGHAYLDFPFTPSALRASAGATLYLTLIALLSLGTAAATRSSAAAIGVMLTLCYAYPLLAAAASDPNWQRRLNQVGPTTAGQMVMSTVDAATQPHHPWTGLLVLAAWTVGTLALGATLLRLRDA